jgi:transposase-like protein
LAQWEQFGKRRNKEEETKREKKNEGLTLTGLLMEGVSRKKSRKFLGITHSYRGA